MTERELQDAILQLATMRGWRCFHPYESRRSSAGWPDLCMVRNERLVFAELKSETGRVRPEQRDWLQALRRTGAEVFVWRPVDWPKQIVKALS